MAELPRKKLKVAFVVATFPTVSETFIINQVADLIDSGVDVEVFAFSKGSGQYISSRYDSYRMAERTHELLPPASKLRRLGGAIPRAIRLFFSHPILLFRSLDIINYGKQAWSLRLLYLIGPFIGKKFDVVHCHFGPIAVQYLTIRHLLKLKTPIVTTFYGYDVSIVFKHSPPDYYDLLKRECSLFFVMSKNMKRRVVAEGFLEDKVKVHPVSIDVESYPYCERRCVSAKPVEIISVGRFVEKKGFDDLLRALAIVRRRTDRAFRCSIVGGGELEKQLRDLTSTLGLNDLVDFEGYMNVEDIIQLLLTKHLMVQASRTAANGDME